MPVCTCKLWSEQSEFLDFADLSMFAGHYLHDITLFLHMQNGKTAIMLAIQQGNIAIVRLLFEFKANLESTDDVMCIMRGAQDLSMRRHCSNYL